METLFYSLASTAPKVFEKPFIVSCETMESLGQNFPLFFENLWVVFGNGRKMVCEGFLRLSDSSRELPAGGSPRREIL